MCLRLMITRPQDDARQLADELELLGVKYLIAPLLSIEVIKTKPPNLEGVQALLLTSANGVRAFANLSKERKIPIYAVGDASAFAAHKVGFENIESAGGDVKTLADLVCKKLNFKNGSLLHIAGSKMAGDLAGDLSQKGFNYRRLQLYHAKAVNDLTRECITAIKDSLVGGVVLYSPRTAKIFINMLTKANLADFSKRLCAFCLSEAVATQIAKYNWKMIMIAKRPDQASLISSIKEYVSIVDNVKLER